MNSEIILWEEYQSVRRALSETLRHDYGPGRSQEYYEECDARLSSIKEAVSESPNLSPREIAEKIKELKRIGIRVALIERSHLGEFSWPFADHIEQMSRVLFRVDELFEQPAGPIVHVIAEGTGYQVVDDNAVRQGLRRILIMAFPRQLKHHVLLHAIFGHELGHPAARSDDLGSSAEAVKEKLAVGPLRNGVSLGDWARSDAAPANLRAQIAQENLNFSGQELDSWRTELFCDLFGLYLFGPSFAAAHRTVLESASGWPDALHLSSSTHPPYPVRKQLLSQVAKRKGWADPANSDGNSACYRAEKAMLDYAFGAEEVDWLNLFKEEQIEAIENEMDNLFAGFTEYAYVAPDESKVRELRDRLKEYNPPIIERISEDGSPQFENVSLNDILYTGWVVALEGDEDAPVKEANGSEEHSRFFLINRLCEQALLSLKAIEIAKNIEPDEPSYFKNTARATTATSGVIGRAKIIQSLETRELIISPVLSKDQLGNSSVNLRMGNVVLVARARGAAVVDPRADSPQQDGPHARETRQRQKHERYELKFGSSFLLHPGTLALVPTLEWFSVPPHLTGNVTARSTWAREGLSIATATMIEPGYKGIITLELANLGQIPIAVYPGIALAQIAFSEVSGDVDRMVRRSQFDLSFEPSHGVLAKKSEKAFLF